MNVDDIKTKYDNKCPICKTKLYTSGEYIGCDKLYCFSFINQYNTDGFYLKFHINKDNYYKILINNNIVIQINRGIDGVLATCKPNTIEDVDNFITAYHNNKIQFKLDIYNSLCDWR